ncbi:MAG TPA: hypothetical protein VGS01_09185 [Candidatus Limnocylindria bacterium]|nr:hypothetical protein [Candidatus Limnocylindria bacterium]
MEGRVTYFHEEQSFRQWWLWALLAIGALFALARLVVDVDRQAITVAFRVLWPTRRIPLSDVRRAEATRYRPLLDYGGYGVRLGFKGWAYNVSGDGGVLVETMSGARVMIGSQRPRDLEAAIARAKREREAFSQAESH